MLSRSGTSQLVGSTARQDVAAHVEVGRTARAVRGAQSLGGGLFLRKAHRRAYVFVVRAGRVRAVGVTTAGFAAHRAQLRGAVRRVLSARADNAPRRFIPNPAQARARLLGRAIAATGNPQTDAALAYYCGLSL